MEFNLVDGGVAFITVVSAILAYARGFTREVLAIAGWAVAAALAAFLTPMTEPLIRELPAVGPFFAQNCILSIIAAFTLVMALGLLILAVFTPVLSSLVLDSALGPIDRVLGFVFGVARAALFIAVAYILYQELVGPVDEWELLANAESRQIIDQIATVITENLPTELPPWVSERIDAMTAPCNAPETPQPAVTPEQPAAPSTSG